MFARFKESNRLALLCTGGVSYLGLVLLLTWQALRGQSVIHTDAEMLAAAAALLSFAGISILMILLQARRANTQMVIDGGKTAHAG